MLQRLFKNKIDIISSLIDPLLLTHAQHVCPTIPAVNQTTTQYETTTSRTAAMCKFAVTSYKPMHACHVKVLQ